MPWWAEAVQRGGSGVRAIALVFTCVTVGGDTRFLTMGAAASGAARHDAPIPGDSRSPYGAETLSLASASHRRHPLPQCGRGWRVHRVGCGSAAQDPLGLDIEGVDRLARGHEQAVALRAAETHVGAALGQQDTADHRAVGREDGDPVLGLAAGPGAPDVAV